MSEVLVIVAVVAVIAIAAFIMTRGRKSSATDVSESPAAVAAPPVEPAVVPKQEEPVEATPLVESPVLEEPQKPAEPATAVGVEEAETEVAEAEPEPVPVPQPSAEEIGERVQSQLADSERMLGELTAAAEGAESSPDLGMLEIMKEGLQEVRTAVDRKDWGQAKDKGDALYAQLSLMVQSMRREQAS